VQAPSSVVDLARQLIAIPSVNPTGDPGTVHTGELAVAEFLKDFLTLAGAEVTLEEVLPGRPNVIARFPTDRPGKPVLGFAPHTDTVGVGGMKIDPFAAEIKNGRLYGRGSCDTKGPMAAQLWALWQMRDQLASLSHEIVFLGLMDEESGQTGAAAAAQSVPLDFVLVGEPTSMEIVHTHKGSLWLEVTATGVASHSSRPDLGRNAIYAISCVIQHLETVVIPRLSLKTHPILGSPTLSVGMIRGGSKINVVPDSCWLQVDVRTIPAPGDLFAELRSEITAIAPGIEVSLLRHAQPLDVAPDHLIIQKWKNLGSPLAGAPWFCDAAVFASHGTPAVALGPGSILQAHTADEFIEISEIKAGANLFQAFLESLR